MKPKRGVIVIIIPLALCALGCPVEAPASSGSGTITITGLSVYEGKYILFATDQVKYIDGVKQWVLGADSFTPEGDISGGKVTNGTVALPAWAMPDDNVRYRPSRLDNNDTLILQYALMYIYDQKTNAFKDWWSSPTQLWAYDIEFVKGSAFIETNY
jgi:hypothetical protein